MLFYENPSALEGLGNRSNTFYITTHLKVLSQISLLVLHMYVRSLKEAINVTGIGDRKLR